MTTRINIRNWIIRTNMVVHDPNIYIKKVMISQPFHLGMSIL